MSGPGLAATLGEQALMAGVDLRFAQAGAITAEPGGAGWRVDLDDGSTVRARAVVVATGTRNRPVPGDEGGDLAGRGVSYCAVCDAPMFRNATVAVYGCDDRALAEVLTVGERASTIHWLVPGAAPPAAATHSDVVTLRSLELHTASEVVAVRADADGLVLTVAAAGAERELRVAGLFSAHGYLPNTDGFGAALPVDTDGYVQSGPGGGVACADRPGLFTAGDVRSGAAPDLAAALGEGTAAGLAAAAYLLGSH
ncbi:MAG: FAD-dependent oxidoreductase [Acidimicrobiales bacterium]